MMGKLNSWKSLEVALGYFLRMRTRKVREKNGLIIVIWYSMSIDLWAGLVNKQETDNYNNNDIYSANLL